jgi:hypothetical protein
MLTVPTNLRLLPCTISRGSFNDEFVFRVVMPDGKDHIGIVSSDYCWTRNNEPISLDKVPSGEKIDGFVACQMLQKLSSSKVRAYLPDGATLTIDEASLQKLTESMNNIPV